MASVAAAAAATQAARQQEQFAAWKRQKSCVLSSAVSAEMHGLPQNEKKEIESGSVEQQLEDESLSPFYLWNSEEDDAPAYRKLRQPMSLESSSGSSLSSMVIGASDQGAAGSRAFNHRTLEKRRNSCASLAEIGEDSLLARLEQSELLYEQFDIVYHLYTSRGPSYDTGWRDKNGAPTTVRDLVKELYEHAGSLKQWWLVRYTAGMLDKRVETLPICLTDLLVRQKQVTIGLPPEPEDCVLTSPKSSAVLADLIKSACGNDITLGMLTQEILVYLSMLAKTESQLFANMHRIRVGLIIRIMGSEIGRSLNVNADEATEHLLSLSPFAMKTLLHYLLSGKEFRAEYIGLGDQARLCILSRNETEMGRSLQQRRQSQRSSPVPFAPSLVVVSTAAQTAAGSAVADASPAMSSDAVLFALQAEQGKRIDSVAGQPAEAADSSSCRGGQWIRRRKIDGALNRVPSGFYNNIWRLIERTDGLSIRGEVIGQHLTREMTAGEVKFALQVESIITRVPVPEYRQLIVEALSLLVRLPEVDPAGRINLGLVLQVEQLVHRANWLFLLDQAEQRGDANRCCVERVINRRDFDSNYWLSETARLPCGGACGVCLHFYDSAPSGRYGTLTYLARAMPDFVEIPQGESGHACIDCLVQ
ncbi:hypothetical protein BOX15_Mlig023206g1 [Macrostomum lignano]|uniref:Phosphorylase b kinase regulatory subunit n=1 Tax=Macrostomum lignano TaxID=282301 RepID=A0A267H0R8_9PLAT|nr:hypothetical protein BOX15_Mlig023206g1 [Macrostomum lignano]